MVTNRDWSEKNKTPPIRYRDPYSKDLLIVHPPPTSHPVWSAISTSRASATVTELGARCQQGAGECSAPASKAWDSPPLPPEASPRTHSHSSRALPPSPLPPPSPLHLLELARLAVHTRQQQPGGLADIIAVHRKAAAVAGMRHGHSDPLHQRGQYEEGPAQEEGGGDVLGPSGNLGCSDPPRLAETPIPPLSLLPPPHHPVSLETLPGNS